MKLKTLEHWKGALSILIGIGSPFGAWAMGESSLRGAIVVGAIAGMTATYNWVDTTLTEAKAKRAAKTGIAATEGALSLTPDAPKTE